MAKDSVSWLQILAVLVGARFGCDRIGSASAKHTKSAKVPTGLSESSNFRDPSVRNLGRLAELRNEHLTFLLFQECWL